MYSEIQEISELNSSDEDSHDPLRVMSENNQIEQAIKAIAGLAVMVILYFVVCQQ